MKKRASQSKWILLVLVPFLAVTIGACSLITKPYITNAGNNKIVNLGDSIFALSGRISDYLHSYAGKTFRRYATSGAELNGGLIEPSVYSQYTRAKNDYRTIDTIFMDGGGNDILIPATMYFDPYNCKVDWWESGLSSKCKSFINDIYVEAVTLFNQMGRDGVKNLIFLGYYNIKFGVIGTTALNPAVAYGNGKLSQAVAYATAGPGYRTFIDPRSSITNSDIIIDGVHPSDSGSKKLATLIWNKLKYLPY